MAELTRHQYQLVVHDLLENRLDHLRRLSGGAHHEAALRALAAAFAALDADTGEVEALTERLRTHTGATATLALLLEAHGRDPLATAEQRAAAGRLHATLVAGQRGPGVSAADRFTHAWRVNLHRATLDADLARLAVPGLAARVDAWLALGLEIGAALGARTDHEDRADAPGAGQLCAEAAARLGDLRAALRIEQRVNPALPANLEAQVLGLFDTLRPSPRRAPATPDAAAPAAVVEPALEPAPALAPAPVVEPTPVG
jgi:hypothetical protein